LLIRLLSVWNQELHSLFMIRLFIEQVQILLTHFLFLVKNLQIAYKFNLRLLKFILSWHLHFYNAWLLTNITDFFFGCSEPWTAYLLIVLLCTVSSLGLELSKVFGLSLESWACSCKMRRNIFNFVISLLELHCVRILWSYTQISGHKLISIRIGRALLKINVIFVKQIYILTIQILIFLS